MSVAASPGTRSVLVVEDDPPMAKYLRALLTTQGYKVLDAASGAEALALAATHRPDVVFLDLGLPDIDGLEVTRRLREWSHVPIIVISARGREDERVEALDLGADDYLTKPFGSAELLARLRVALRHIERFELDDESCEVVTGRLRVDLSTHRVEVDGEPLSVTAIEYRLLAMLARHLGRVLTHRQILAEVWGPGHSNQPHYVRVYVAQLRKKIERDPGRPELLLTETGVGYRLLDVPAESETDDV